MSAIRFDVLTLFPGLFDGFLNESILGKSIERGQVRAHLWNLREWAEGRHKQVDDTPYGGGPGMVLMAPPIVSAVEDIQARDTHPGRLIALSPRGRRFDQEQARRWPGSLVSFCFVVAMRGSTNARSRSSRRNCCRSEITCSPAARCRRWWSSNRSSG